MTDTGDRQSPPFPPALAAALAAPFDYADGEGVDLGSEGETAVIASGLNAFLWLLAEGYGPWEAATVHDPDWTLRANLELQAVATRFAAGHQRARAHTGAGRPCHRGPGVRR
ncbi:hypothetical protein [Streptomyces sp. L2]|uniref:hypothetical protein n=1 Tax=Streptomyces sp. L2 TaxID=2162665 RepID=UPI0019D6CB81|nr:hypothetical protein [Streptomyces sp. L2]